LITKEQAEQAFHRRYDHPETRLKPEIRNLQIEEIDAQDLMCNDDLGVFDVQEQIWRCTFESRYRHLDQGEWTGHWHEWHPRTCYVVEPQSGPYVID
jgi:hypothetical protein